MPYCQMCGKQIPEEAATCLYCGVTLQDNSDNPGNARFCRSCGKPIDQPGNPGTSDNYVTYEIPSLQTPSVETASAEIPSLEIPSLEETQESNTCPLCGNGVKATMKNCPYCGVGLR